MPSQKEKPIIFSSDMVRAILENRKSQTRRVIKPQPNDFVLGSPAITLNRPRPMVTKYKTIKCPYGKVGDRLWVRETWSVDPMGKRNNKGDFKDTICYKAEGDWDGPWKSPLFMKREHSRITLEITDIKVERLQEITIGDCEKEGIRPPGIETIKGFDGHKKYAEIQFKAFEQLWNSLAKKGFKWEDNPWVWVISFKRVL